MTSSNYRTERFDKEHIHNGGIILPSDFEIGIGGSPDQNRSNIADRIAADFKHEADCLRIRNNTFIRREIKQWKIKKTV